MFLVYVSVECVPEVVERVPEVSGRTSRDLGVVGVGVVGVGVVGVGVVEVVLCYPGFGRYKFPDSSHRAKRVLDKKPEVGGSDFEDFQGGQFYSREVV